MYGNPAAPACVWPLDAGVASARSPHADRPHRPHRPQASFGPFYRISQLILSTGEGGGPITTDSHLRTLFAMHELVDQLAAPYGEEAGAAGNATLSSVCFKPLGAECAIQSVAQYWQLSVDVYEHGGCLGVGVLSGFVLVLIGCRYTWALGTETVMCEVGMEEELCRTDAGPLHQCACLWPGAWAAQPCLVGYEHAPLDLHSTRSLHLSIPQKSSPPFPRAGSPPMMVPVTPEFCYGHWNTQCLSAYGAPIDPHVVLGGFPTAAAEFRNFSADATAFVVTFLLDPAPALRCVGSAMLELGFGLCIDKELLFRIPTLRQYPSLGLFLAF